MKTAIVYVSTHHGNTLKLAKAIADKHGVDLIDATGVKTADLTGYDRIGFAAGIAFGRYYPQLLTFMQENLPEGKQVFFLHTAGDPREKHADAAKQIAEQKGCRCLGVYFCKGYDTYGPLKLIGGICKGHPDADEIEGAVRFYEGL